MATDSDRWKNKYLNLIDDHEKLDSRYQEHSTQLRRALIRLTVVAEGRDDDLDTQLEAARELLRKEQLTGLSRVMERVDQGYERWLGHQESFQQRLSEAVIAIEVSHEQLPSSFMQTLKGLRKKLRSSDQPTLLLEFTNVLNSWADQLTAEGQEEQAKGSWFSRLFAKEMQVDQDAQGTNDSQEEGSTDYNIQPEKEDQAGLNNLSNEASKVLSDLIKKLSLPNSEQPRALRLLGKVNAGLSWFELVPALEILADLVISALGTEQEEFEAFLKNLNERLLALQQWLSQGERLEQKFSEASNVFDQKMSGHLAELKNLLANGADAKSLKGSISQQLDDVFATMDGFKLEQRSREIAFKQHIKELGDRIANMEQDLTKAKEELGNSQMKAMTDSLTQLPNRGAYDVYIQKEYERYRRYGGDLCMLVCDVDKFKSINDNYGHQAGDKVLQLISKLVKQGTRETDLLSRYGGEEFVVILPETNIESAMKVAEKIREKVSNSPFHFKGVRVQITISCGVAQFQTGYRPEQVFDAADAALYVAKENGRNQCQIGELKGTPGEEPEGDGLTNMEDNEGQDATSDKPFPNAY